MSKTSRQERFNNMRRGCPLMTEAQIYAYLDESEAKEAAKREFYAQFSTLERMTIVAARACMNYRESEPSVGMGPSAHSCVMDVLDAAYVDHTDVRLQRIVAVVEGGEPQ